MLTLVSLDFHLPELSDQPESIFNHFVGFYWLHLLLFPVFCGEGCCSRCKRKKTSVSLLLFRRLEEKSASAGMTELAALQ